MTVRMRLAALAGARPGLLEKTPGDIAKYATMGGVLVSTALVSSVSAFFALYSALKLPAVLAAAIGVCWGVIILNLDRMLVTSMNRQNGFWLNVWMVLPRLLLAATIGVVVSMPLVLRVFQPEIDSELTIMRAESTAQARAAHDEAFAQITMLEQREQRLQDAVAGKSDAAVSADPDVRAAKAAHDEAEKAYRTAQDAAQCELDGTCGTGDQGVGEAYRQKQRAADDAKAARDSAKQNLDDVTARVTEELRAGARTTAAAAARELPAVQTDLARYRDQRRVAEEASAEAEAENTGLLARLEALSRITDDRPSGATAHWMLFLLFLSIEVLPVVSKFLASLGPPSVYDRLLVRQDEDIDRADQVWSAKRQQLVDHKADVPMQIELHKANAQLAAGKIAVDALVDRQTRIALNAVAVWGDLAERRSDEELDQWYRQHIGRTPVPPRSPRVVDALTTSPTMPMRPVRPPTNGSVPGNTP
jgi:hypothetical protein